MHRTRRFYYKGSIKLLVSLEEQDFTGFPATQVSSILLLDLSLLQPQIIAMTLPTLNSRNRVASSTKTTDLEEETPLLSDLQLHGVRDRHL